MYNIGNTHTTMQCQHVAVAAKKVWSLKNVHTVEIIKITRWSILHV